MVESINTVVVGGGQAGIAASEHLSKCNIPHVVLERARIAERWRSERWDSLAANGPAWHDRFPGLEFPDTAPDAFPPKERVADYFEAYARMLGAPIRCGVEVTSVERSAGGRSLLVKTSAGEILTQNVIAATGPFQCPSIPAIVPEDSGLYQLHSSAYRNPEQLPAGNVLVVGSGASGSQIALDLMEAGRTVYLSVGKHQRPPRRYRGRDFSWWLGVLGKWDVATPGPDAAHVTIAVSGARGGETIDFRRLARQGVVLVGSTQSYSDSKIGFSRDIRENIEEGNASYLAMLDEADDYAARFGLDLPADPHARDIAAATASEINPILELDPTEVGITTILWATGFTADYGWLKLDVLDSRGKPRHQRGVSPEPGIFFLGLPWQSNRGSSFIWGVWHDAKYVADHIANQQKYAFHNAWVEQQSASAEPGLAQTVPGALNA